VTVRLNDPLPASVLLGDCDSRIGSDLPDDSSRSLSKSGSFCALIFILRWSAHTGEGEQLEG
jgi:hypothetical protein